MCFLPGHPHQPSCRGFTLIEVMVALAVVAILATIAYPSYVTLVLQSRRLDAVLALAELQQAQAQWRTRHRTYADGVVSLGLQATSEDHHYQLAITQSDATGYVATAHPIGAQSRDAGCSSLTLTVTGANVSYQSSGTEPTTRCWRQ